MNCEEFRRAVGAEPSTTQLEALEHAASCAECARYRAEMRAMDGLIHKSLAIDVNAPLVAVPERRTAMNWRIAATVLISVMVFSLGWLAYPRQSLAADIVTHVMAESVLLAPNDLNVSFALVCGFRGHEAPHLVVRTPSGPVTVLVLSHEDGIAKPQRFEEQGFAGTLVPAPRGVIAVLGRDVPLEQITQDVLRALTYE